MNHGEIPSYCLDLSAKNCESITYDNLDIANTWANNTSDCEGDQVDPNLVLTRSFTQDKATPTTSKFLTSAKSPSYI